MDRIAELDLGGISTEGKSRAGSRNVSSGSGCAACSRAQWVPESGSLGHTDSANRGGCELAPKGITVLLILNLLRGAMAAQLRGRES